MLLPLNIITLHGLLQVAFLALSPAACGLTMDSITVHSYNHWLATSTLPSLIPSIVAYGSLSSGLESATGTCNRLISLNPTHTHHSIESCPSAALHHHSSWFTVGSAPALSSTVCGLTTDSDHHITQLDSLHHCLWFP